MAAFMTENKLFDLRTLDIKALFPVRPFAEDKNIRACSYESDKDINGRLRC